MTPVNRELYLLVQPEEVECAAFVVLGYTAVASRCSMINTRR